MVGEGVNCESEDREKRERCRSMITTKLFFFLHICVSIRSSAPFLNFIIL
jgi:hypothetical protein